ncbi:LytTR family DNA-binding domain-containing protein [Enterococcus faecalis]|uniref:LytR/AlgR family response regulator transcription factor n=1 Tax=Enterococcus TaxID=1350 RepID=UPI001927AF80|nr:LytTR family DNA-binding domain-containing protein [Enterococcus faecalis]MDN3139747.1 LytTR family DNA-binding domain-containing protein [Enterococcus faecalis]
MHIVICDSDKKYAEICKDLISECLGKTEFFAKFSFKKNIDELYFFIEDNLLDIDLIYVDINIDRDLEVIKKIRLLGYDKEIVFYTKTGKFAIDGYDVDALNYIIKGNGEKEKFKRVLKKAILRNEKRMRESIVLTCAGKSKCIFLEEIFYFEICARIVSVHYGQYSTFEFYSTISRLEEQLANKGFIRIHKSYLVNKKNIAKVTSNQVILTNNEVIPLGRKYKNNIY